MKKIRSLLLVLLCLAVLAVPVSADSGDDAYRLYRQAAKKVDSATSLETRGKMRIEMSWNDAATTVEATTYSRQIHGDDGLQMEMHVSGDAGVISSAYYKDGYYYQDLSGRKVKSKMQLDQAASSFDIGLTKALLRDAEVEGTPGGKRIKVRIGAADLDDIFGGLIEALYADMGIPGAAISFRSATYTLLLDQDSLPKSYAVALNGSMQVDGTAVHLKYATSFKVTSINSVVRIAYPTDLDDYRSLLAA